MSFIRLPIFHPPRLLWQCFCCLLLLTGSPFAAQFQGTATSFGRQQCFMLDHFPADSGATYRENDAKKEQELCGVSFEDKGIGLCPKTWSTSPGTIVYGIRESKPIPPPQRTERQPLLAVRMSTLTSYAGHK